MPEIGRIQSTTFQTLLTELGITRNNIPFALRSEVTPVVLVGGTVSFLAAPTPAYRVPDAFSAGELTNPAAATIMADTGPLPIGAYSLQVLMQAQVSNNFRFQWRDVANAADLVSHMFRLLDQTNSIFNVRLNVENDNERFRVLIDNAGGAGNIFQVTIFARV